MYIKEIIAPDALERASLIRLLNTLTTNSTFTDEKLNNLLQASESHLYGLYEDEELIGCCCLGIYYSITGKKACLEDVVVLPEHQGKSGGRMLVAYATEEARKHHVGQLLFTSNPKRVKANQLYQKMEFERKETNVYIKKW